MKFLILVSALNILMFLNTNLLFSQLSVGGNPLGKTKKELRSDIPVYHVQQPNMEQIFQEDLENSTQNRALRAGVLIETNINPQSQGLWETLPNGDLLWRLKIISSNATGTSLFFDNFYLPTGARLFAYNPDFTEVIGAFTEINNHESGLMATQPLIGEVTILELYLPAGKRNDFIINISEVAYIYRGLVTSNEKAADFCLVNINCPEGINWQSHKRSVARANIRIGSNYFFCTGSLMNNTQNNCIPYFLLADHCAYYNNYATASNLLQWVFNFNYESANCTINTSSTNQSLTGCTLVANDTYGMNSQGSDFYLVRLNNNVPASFQPYYNGWSRQNIGATSGVSIHHPDGDIKKISTFTQPATNYFTNHWLIRWAQTVTNHSVTEQGSSGGPLYNQNGLLVGTLTGGGSFCATPNEADIYGKFSRHWDSQGTTSNKQLKPWLDPTGTNPQTLAGITFNQCTSTEITDVTINTNLLVYPNPASEFIKLKFENYYFSSGTIRIIDLMGKTIKSYTISNFQNEFVFSVVDLKDGIYFISAMNEKNSFSKSFVINRK